MRTTPQPPPGHPGPVVDVRALASIRRGGGSCLLIAGHGSRDPAANQEFEALVLRYREANASARVAVAYIEHAAPLVGDALLELAAQHDEIVLLPLFLFAAGHVKNDLPAAVATARARFPRTTVTAAPALGVHPALVELAWQRAAIRDEDRARTMLLVVGRGSSDADANGDFCKLVRLIGERRGLFHVEPTFIGVTTPLVARSLEVAARLRPERLVVLPYFLFAGELVARLAAQIAVFAEAHRHIETTLAPHLGAGDGLLSLMAERARMAKAGESVLPCDTCRHRRGGD